MNSASTTKLAAFANSRLAMEIKKFCRIFVGLISTPMQREASTWKGRKRWLAARTTAISDSRGSRRTRTTYGCASGHSRRFLHISAWPLWPVSDLQFEVANTETGVIQAPEPGPRIMRYELTDFECAAIRPFLPNKPRGVPVPALRSASPRAQAKSFAVAATNQPAGQITQKPVKPVCEKYSAFPKSQINLPTTTSHPMRGAARDRHERAVGCGGRDGGK